MDRKDLRTLKNLADVSMRPIYLIFQRWWWSKEVPEDWRKASLEPTFKGGKSDDLRNYKHDNLTLESKKLMEQVLQGEGGEWK